MGRTSEGDSNSNVIELEFVTKAENYGRQVDAIRQVLSRDHMKVVFFGRTSNGKSTLINAMLGDRILPTGIGHTTSCFLQVEGGDEVDAYLLTDEDEKQVRHILKFSPICDSSLRWGGVQCL